MKSIALLTAALIVAAMTASCGKTGTSGHKWQNSDTLNEWQMDLLEAQGLPTDIEKLTPMQKLSIQHIYEMITYLNDKYDEEFVYAGYIQPGLMDEETLLAYPKQYGADGGRNTVEVTVGDDGDFKDNYSNMGVRNYYEQLINDFAQNFFGSSEVKVITQYFESEFNDLNEIKNDDFEKKVSATNLIFVSNKISSKEKLRVFFESVLNWMTLHNIYGDVRTTLIKNANIAEIFFSNYGDFYESEYIEDDHIAVVQKNGEFIIGK